MVMRWVVLVVCCRRCCTEGPDDAISASKYCFMGGFDATSNVLAGNLFGIPLCGTHSHAYVSSYMVMRSGIPNFCAVALALHDLGYKASGVRLDSGDLAYLSIEARKVFRAIEEEFNIPDFGKMIITASNDLNEETIDALNKQGHEVDAFGIGTYLVTCYSQAALGCVFKLVEINSRPRIKLSEDVAKVSIPCKKRCFILYGKEGYPLVDIMIRESEPSPKERDVSEESGWKLVHGDVFRPPRSLMFLSALVGIGTQLVALILLVIVLAIVGMLYNERGAIITTFIVFYALTSFISGYVSGGLYSRNGVK